jgi:hypothetical protein
MFLVRLYCIQPLESPSLLLVCKKKKKKKKKKEKKEKKKKGKKRKKEKKEKKNSPLQIPTILAKFASFDKCILHSPLLISSCLCRHVPTQ